MAPATSQGAQWEGYNIALKPAWEPIVLARKPLAGTVARNVIEHGTGALNVKGCGLPRVGPPSGWSKTGTPQASENIAMAGPNMPRAPKPDAETRYPSNLFFDADLLPKEHARYFFCPKVSTRERNAGCEHLAKRGVVEMVERDPESIGAGNGRAGAGRTNGAHNHHPTLKPIALNEWLARLILQPVPDATLLVPYSGAGSEIIGAIKSAWPVVFGVEQDPEYVELAQARIAHHCT
jgi:site-specific DNA-methyltransferase (adenine-specific)